MCLNTAHSVKFLTARCLKFKTLLYKFAVNQRTSNTVTFNLYAFCSLEDNWLWWRDVLLLKETGGVRVYDNVSMSATIDVIHDALYRRSRHTPRSLSHNM